MSDYREKEAESLRVLFCFGVSQSFFEEEGARLPELVGAIREAFADLGGRFGAAVLGTFDDDEAMVGPSETYPWTAYILADVPAWHAVTQITNVLRETEVGPYRLWKYMKVEARIGRKLFFGNE
jgi:hypothetical protein